MTTPARDDLDALWARHTAEWRDQAQITSQWREATTIDPRLLRYRTRGAWWETLALAGITLLVTREYEHLVMALTVEHGEPRISYTILPHPSGIAVDHQHQTVFIASTRNPNQVYDFAPVCRLISRLDIATTDLPDRVLLPLRSRFLPGCLYMHDLALIGRTLYANAVGHNAIVRLDADGSYERVWWPRCIEQPDGPVFGQNHIQLNSIAAGDDLASSYFSASADKLSARRPGHKNFPVDRRGVIFSGATREPMARGLTRPHSARLYGGTVWVDNSGYGELGYTDNEQFIPFVRLPGWTRGLCFRTTIAFVGTSRVIPRFRQYAPGLDVERSECSIHAVDITTGQVLGSFIWPYGNQIFAVDYLEQTVSPGFPFVVGLRRVRESERVLFYAFDSTTDHEM